MMTKSAVGFGIATVIVVAAACTGGVDPDAIVLRTDSTTYVATYLDGEGTYRMYGFRVVAALENHSGATAYLARCYPDSPTPIFGVTLVDAEDAWGQGTAVSGRASATTIRLPFLREPLASTRSISEVLALGTG